MEVQIMPHCIRCGMCADLYPTLFAFDMAEDVIKLKKEVFSAEEKEKIKQMSDDCAVGAIRILK